jgi:hypothetical protein
MSEPLRDTDGAPDEEPVRSDPDAPGPGLPPPTSIESLVNALLEAGPDVADHVVRAAQELLLAAQVIVDAAEKAVREQQDVRANTDDSGPAAEVRHLDVAE